MDDLAYRFPLDFDIHKRVGSFYVSVEYVYSRKVKFLLDLLDFVPLHVECLLYIDRYRYTGSSPAFEAVKEGNIPPNYIWRLHIPSAQEERYLENASLSIRIGELSLVRDGDCFIPMDVDEYEVMPMSVEGGGSDG